VRRCARPRRGVSMSESKLYAPILAHREGVLLTEENQIDITRDFANKEIITVARGFAGIVKGAAITRVTVRNAVPMKGVEYDPGPDGASGKAREWTFIRGAQQLTGKFIILQDKTSHQASNESDLNFDLVGPPTQWEAL
jgi:hypothetical protein